MTKFQQKIQGFYYKIEVLLHVSRTTIKGALTVFKAYHLMSSLKVFKVGLLQLSRTAVERALQDLHFPRSTIKRVLLQFLRSTIAALLQFSMTTIKGVL